MKLNILYIGYEKSKIKDFLEKTEKTQNLATTTCLQPFCLLFQESRQRL